MTQEYLIALGSNLGSSAGDPAQTVRAALDAMPAKGITPLRVSRLYATPCFPAGTGPDYVNACCAARFDLGRTEIATFLHKLHEIEADFGRARLQRWGSRTLDLDLLAVGDTILPDPETYDTWQRLTPQEQTCQTPDQLILPHPRLQDRAFVLVPLMDVAPTWQHPVLRQSTAELCAALPDHLRAEPVAL
ncbi:2-amino-4-hydroxy-6-hydroxymethyldihydropteridine diphosphokinase [Sagittula marina]|uniref:2-amino-4-hydroxy-6- hydroxymethyldihydropteridine diphosphokinase n=1 Tax=Sagittula marina TaxID=943940 RepID=UPI001620A378|nr:2-amino-4-hydroxy-6-hydroxymethyldihydropteridine diphosphokinase [Sagittula marina]